MRRRLGGAAALLVGALLLASCAQQGVSTQGQDIHDLYVRIFLLAAPVFVAVEAFLLWCVFRYRKRDDKPAPQDAGSGRVLLVFFAIPTVIIAILFPFGEQTLGYVEHRDKNPDLTINVDAFQWEWTFNYVSEGLVESGKTLVKPAVMEVPVNQTIHIHLQSRDVMNDFDFTPTKLGTYPAQCAEFCGLWHSKMTFTLKVVPEADYIAWVQSEKAAALNVSCPVGPLSVPFVAQNTKW